MRLRLGDWDCASCGHVEPAAVAPTLRPPVSAPLAPPVIDHSDYFERRDAGRSRQKRTIVIIYAAAQVLPLMLLAGMSL